MEHRFFLSNYAGELRVIFFQVEKGVHDSSPPPKHPHPHPHSRVQKTDAPRKQKNRPDLQSLDTQGQRPSLDKA